MAEPDTDGHWGPTPAGTTTTPTVLYVVRLSKPQAGEACPRHGVGRTCRYCEHTHEGPPSRSTYTAGCRHFECREANRLYALAWRQRKTEAADA